MAFELVLASSFVELQRNLFERIGTLCKDHPFGSKWILTPTSAVAEHCKLSLSRAGSETVLSGVHVLPLSRFLGSLMRACGLDYIPRYHPALDLLLYSLVQRLSTKPELSYLAKNPTSFLGLRSTFLDLADGGFGLEQAFLLTELSSEAELMEIERLVLNLYVAWLETLEAASLNWEPLVHQKLARWISRTSEREFQETISSTTKGPSADFFLYGFYDFTDVNTQIIAALGKRLKLTLYFPHATAGKGPHPAFSFSDMVLQDLSARFASSLHSREVIEKRDIADPVTRFFLSTFPVGECFRKPEFLTVQQASGIRAEVISAAVRVRKWLDDNEEPINADEIMVLVPDLEAYHDEVREVFAAFSIPLSSLDRPSQGDPEYRTLLMLRKLWTSKGDVEWLLTLFRDFPDLLSRRGIELEGFENKLRELPVSAGEVWKRLSELLQTTDQRSLPRFDRAEINLISEIIEIWVERPVKGIPVQQARKLMLKIGQCWTGDAAALKAAQGALDLMAELLPTLIIPEEVFGLLLSQPKGALSEPNPFGQPGVLFSSIMRARGITAKAVVILGLSLGQFPARVEEDPLLSDSSRKRLKRIATDVGHRLPVKSRVIDEMSLLFFLLNTSAGKIHWVVPRTDESGKNVAPTPWVQHYLHRWKNSAATDQIPRGPVEQALFLHSLDPVGGSMLPPTYLAFLDSQIPTMPPQHHGDPSRHGQIEAAKVSPENHPERLSVTELEVLAQCPFHFYSTTIAGWRMIRPLSLVIEPDALEWGSLLHKSLERQLRPSLAKELTLKHLLLSSDEAPQLDLEGLANSLPARHKLLAEPLRLAIARKLLMTIRSYLEAIKSDDCADGQPKAQELKLRMPYPGREYLTISGQIDRVDWRDGQFHIVDYKSGREPWTSRAERASSIHLGHRLQPLLYPWLYQVQEDLSYTPSFSYVFLGCEPPKEVSVSMMRGPETLLRSLVSLLEGGSFFPTSNELMREWGLKYSKPCQYCQLNSLCRRFDTGNRSQNESYFRTLAQQRFQVMTQQVSDV